VSDLDIFRVLGNENRRKILKLLFEEELHINGIAKRLGISVPVVFKHVKVLEDNELIERKKIGNMHVLKIRSAYVATIRKVFNAIEKSHMIKAEKGETLLSVFKRVSGIGLKKSKNGYFVDSIDGKKGFFLFEVNGKIPNRPLEKVVLKKNSEVSFYRLTPVLGKIFEINLTE